MEALQADAPGADGNGVSEAGGATCIKLLTHPASLPASILPVSAIVGLMISALSIPAGFAAVAAAAAASALLYDRDRRRLTALLDSVGCDGVLRRPLLAAPGYVYSYFDLAGEYSRQDYRFEPSGDARMFETFDWGHASGYLAAAGHDWLLLWLPAYEIRDGCCPGYHIAAVTPSLVRERGPAELSLHTEEGDYAKAEVRVGGGAVEAALEFRPVRARSARVEMAADLGPKKLKVRLAESRGGLSTGAVPVTGRPGVYVLRGAVSPSAARKIGIEQGQIWGLGLGNYKARLVIDRPWRRGAVAEAPL